jgi:2-methylisocitrate lyase-like PEP mutase family enzyme
MPGKEVVPLTEMVKKVEAACLARHDDQFMIIARTDALAIEGLDGTLRRVRAYVEAGADMIFPDAARNEDDIKRIVEAAGDVPVTINMGFGIRARPTTPLIPIPDLKRMGVRRISLPRMLPAAAIMGMQLALTAMKTSIETGVPQDRPDLAVGIDDIMKLMGYDEMRELERQLLSTEALEAKYGSDKN